MQDILLADESILVSDYCTKDACRLFHDMLAGVAGWDYNCALGKLERWRDARPFLRIGQSGYAISLVYEVIDACERWYKFSGKPRDDNHIAGLYRLINTPPPPLPPASASPRPFLFPTAHI